MDIRPDLVEFALSKEFQALVQLPQRRTVTSDDFLALIPNFSRRWFEEKSELLRNELRQDLGCLPAEVTDPLDLAIAVWFCQYCNVVLRYPAVLAHPCLYHGGNDYRGSQVKGLSYSHTVSCLELAERNPCRDRYHVEFKYDSLCGLQ